MRGCSKHGWCASAMGTCCAPLIAQLFVWDIWDGYAIRLGSLAVCLSLASLRFDVMTRLIDLIMTR